jgi:hypothetical protein
MSSEEDHNKSEADIEELSSQEEKREGTAEKNPSNAVSLHDILETKMEKWMNFPSLL